MALNLEQHHQKVISSYMTFAHYMRSQNLKQIMQPFQEVESRLFEDTYTRDEVKEIVGDLQSVVLSEVESELTSFSHNNILMLQQLFQQAEKHYLRLEVDISELENQEKLEKVRVLDSDFKLKLRPEDENKETVLLRVDVVNLKEENERLRKIIEETQEVDEVYQHEIKQLGEHMKRAQEEVAQCKKLLENTSLSQSELTDHLKAKMAELDEIVGLDMDNPSVIQNFKKRAQLHFADTIEKLERTKARLRLVEQEMERRINETSTVANMKQMLMRKNEKIRELKNKYEPGGSDDPEPTEN